MNISQSVRKGRNTHLVPNEYLQIQKYRQTALNGVQLGRAQISNHQYKTHLVFKEI